MIEEVSEREFLKAILRKDFKSFAVKVFNEVSPNATFLDNWHIDVMIDNLLDVLEGKKKRLIINIPPRYMKSIICSIAFPAFILGHNPKAPIIVVSYADELAVKLASDCRRVMESAWYQELFPGTRLSKRATNDLETTRGGGRYATSVNGTLTGRGADYIIIDDPIKPQDAFSDTIREKTNEWYCNTLYSRLDNQNEGKIILIMQRLHENDLTGYLLENDSSFYLSHMRAIAECYEERHIRNGVCFQRKKGEALHPERESLEKLLQLKKTVGEYTFAGQYQQNPAPREGGVIKEAWLNFYNKAKLLKQIEEGEIQVDYIMQSWDTAYKTEEMNDYSVCVTILVDKKGDFYILDVYREKLQFPTLIKAVVNKHNQAKMEYKKGIDVLIEDKASGQSIIQELRHNHLIYARKINPEYDKKTRLMAVSHLVENGKCRFPDHKPAWWRDFEQELLRFPQVKHDDQCDALSQALAYKKSRLRTRLA